MIWQEHGCCEAQEQPRRFLRALDLTSRKVKHRHLRMDDRSPQPSAAQDDRYCTIYSYVVSGCKCRRRERKHCLSGKARLVIPDPHAYVD